MEHQSSLEGLQLSVNHTRASIQEMGTYIAPDKGYQLKYFSYFCTKRYVVGNIFFHAKITNEYPYYLVIWSCDLIFTSVLPYV